MTDVSVRQGQDGSPADTPGGDGDGEDAVPNYGPWVSFFGYVHRLVPYENVVLGGATVVGALALGAYVVALFAESVAVSPVATLGAVGGGLLFGFGLCYLIVRHDTSCEECGADFSKEQVGKTIECRETDGRTQPVQTLECRNCGHRTTATCSSQEQNPPTW